MRYAIIGGGAAGCALAWHLTQNGHQVVVYERWNGLGGLASEIPFGKTSLDRFYHHIFTSDRHVLAFAEMTGLSDKLRWCDSSVGFEHQGKLYPFTTPKDLLTFSPLPFLSRFRVGLAVLRMRRRESYADLESVTAEDFIIREMGESAYRVLWEPLLRSKFGDSYREVSAVWFWGKIKLRGGTRSKKGGESLGYMKDGWAQIYQRMGEAIQRRGGEFRFREIVKRVSRTPEGLSVKTRSSEDVYDRVISTPSIPSFLEIAEGLPEDYRSQLGRVRYQANVCLALGLKHAISPYYWLNVTHPESPFVAVIDHTRLFDDPDYGESRPVYLSRYLDADHPYYSMRQPELIDTFLDGLEKIFPRFSRDWVETVEASKAEFAQPVIGLHYSKQKPAFTTPIEGLYLCTMAQIYPEDRGMNYALKTAEELLLELGEIKRLSA
ncbi:MAG: FAD-dependent oxidoreductase [bacterium]|nr:FAD-dependent oxidoreductase [bacterium]